ncbi:hypothetical protein [Nocardioides sp. GXQ0305]|uniref:hypothetical protein n=1 Tax=Nocardioides sp. GXQ0305 TaxID=3423912 RepID=UPI003D7CB33E
MGHLHPGRPGGGARPRLPAGAPTLVHVDPGSAAVVGRLPLSDELPLYDEANLDLALVDGEAWVTSYAADRVHHVPADDVPAG